METSSLKAYRTEALRISTALDRLQEITYRKVIIRRSNRLCCCFRIVFNAHPMNYRQAYVLCSEDVCLRYSFEKLLQQVEATLFLFNEMETASFKHYCLHYYPAK